MSKDRSACGRGCRIDGSRRIGPLPTVYRPGRRPMSRPVLVRRGQDRAPESKCRRRNSFCRSEDVLSKPFLQPAQPPAGRRRPSWQGSERSISKPCRAKIWLCGRAADDRSIWRPGHERAGRGVGEALGDRPLRGRRLVDGPGRPGSIARPTDTDGPGGVPAHGRASRSLVSPIICSGPPQQEQGLDARHRTVVLARQVCWQARPARLAVLGELWSWLMEVWPSALAKIGVEILEAELQS